MTGESDVVRNSWFSSVHHCYAWMRDTLESVPGTVLNTVPFFSALDRLLTAGVSQVGRDGSDGGHSGPRALSASELQNVRLVSILSLALVATQSYRAIRIVRKQWKRSSRRQGLFAWSLSMPTDVAQRADVKPLGKVAFTTSADIPHAADASEGEDVSRSLASGSPPPSSATHLVDDPTTTDTADATNAMSKEVDETGLLMAEVLNRYWRQVRRAILLAPRSPSPLQPFPDVLPYMPPRTHKHGPVLLRTRKTEADHGSRHHSISKNTSENERGQSGGGEAGDAKADGNGDINAAGTRCDVCRADNASLNGAGGRGTFSAGERRKSKTTKSLSLESVFSLPMEGVFIYTHRPDEFSLSADRLFFEDPLGSELAMGAKRPLKSSAHSVADLSELSLDRPGKHEASGRFSSNPDDPRTFWEALFVSWVGSVQYPVSFREIRKLLLSTAPSAFLGFVNTETTYGPTVKDISCANMALLWYVECLRRIHQSLVVYRDIERCEDEVEELRKYAPVLYRLCIARWPKPAEMEPIAERVLATYNIFVMCSPQGAWLTLECARVELLALRRRMNYESLFSLGRYLYASSGSKRVSTALIAMLTALSTKVHSVGRLLRERLNHAVNEVTSSERQHVRYQQQGDRLSGSTPGDSLDSSSATSTRSTSTTALWTLVGFELVRVMLNYTITRTSSEFIALTAARRHETVRAQLLEAFAHMPLSYFEHHSSDDIESILYYVDDMEGLDVQLNQFAFNTVNALMTVGESLFVLNARALVVVAVSVAFPRLLKRFVKLVEGRYRNLEQVGALPWLVIQSDSDSDEDEDDEEGPHPPQGREEGDSSPVMSEEERGAAVPSSLTTRSAQRRRRGRSHARHKQQPGMLLWGTPLPPLRHHAAAAAMAGADADDDDFAREGFMFRGEEIIYSLAHLRPYGADTRLVHWWNRYTELQNRARAPGGGGWDAPPSSALDSTWRFFVSTLHELLWLPYGKVIPGLGAAVRELVEWLTPLLITNYGVVWSGLAAHLSQLNGDGGGGGMSVDLSAALFALSDAVDAVDSAADVLAEGVDMVSVVLANAYKASVLENLLSPEGWERYSYQEARHLANKLAPNDAISVVCSDGAGGGVDLLNAQLYRAYTISEVRFHHLQCQYTDAVSGGVMISTTSAASTAADESARATRSDGRTDAVLPLAAAARGVFKQPLSFTLHLYPGPTPIRGSTTHESTSSLLSASTVMRGCFVCLTGPNGSGKSTLTSVLLGLTQNHFAAAQQLDTQSAQTDAPVVLAFTRQPRCFTGPSTPAPSPPPTSTAAAAEPRNRDGVDSGGGLRSVNQVLNPSFIDLAAISQQKRQRATSEQSIISAATRATVPARADETSRAPTLPSQSFPSARGDAMGTVHDVAPLPPAFEVPLACVPADVLRRRLFSYVPETPILFNGATVAHNIALAGYVSLASEEVLTRARICATAARCTFINQLPLGLLTKVTDGGTATSSSGGGSGDGIVRLTLEQQQLLMIARALYHGGDVLLMDEPTRRAEPATVRALRDLWREMLAVGIVKSIICFTAEPCLLEMADQVITLAGDDEPSEDDSGVGDNAYEL